MFESGFENQNPHIQCKCCGQKSVIPMPIFMGHEDSEELMYTCLICKDNWIAEKYQADDDSGVVIIFVHNINIRPQLERTAYVQSEVLIDSIEDEDWTYCVGEAEVEKEEWFNILDSRRKEMKSAVVN